MSTGAYCPSCGRRASIISAPSGQLDRFCPGPWSYTGAPRWDACDRTFIEEAGDPDDCGVTWSRAAVLRTRRLLLRLTPSGRRSTAELADQA